MKADPTAQLRLLDLQDLDARADQLRHRRAALPELAEIAALQRDRVTLDDSARDQRIVVEDLTAEQEKIDGDVEQVKARRKRDRERMDAGLITNPKDLERMTEELVSLERRISTLEDAEIEVMERVEEASAALTRLEEQLAATDRRLADLADSRDRALAGIDQELAAVAAERDEVAGDVPDDLTALYDKLRAAKGGVGAAPLRARECGGCRLTVDAAELAVIKAAAADEVLRCEECQRILVRTPESGL